MAKDPFLAAHSIADCCFEVGGEFSPASIRDQMIRAYLLVDRAFQETIIGAGRDLLVVGAGPSGLTAAIRAAELGVKTLVVEKRARHAFLLAGCRSRDVEPTFYDWPLDHWARDRFGWTGAHMELQWRADRANIIALDWQRKLPGILAAYPQIGISYSTSPNLLPGGRPPTVGPAGLLDVPIIDRHGTTTIVSCGGLVSCIGFGKERTSVGRYTGFQFWETDDYQRPNCGRPKPPRILISGGGDGALQDFVRVMTLRSTKAVFAVLLRALARTPWLIAAMHSDLHSAEDVATRALSWNAPHHDEPVLRRLENAHEAVINRIQASPAWPAVLSAVRALFPRTVPNVQLVHRGHHFSPCYPLNRFLALLILRVLSPATPIRLINTQVTKIRGLGHACMSAATCHGHPHDVTLKSIRGTRTAQYDVVILRHGIAGPRHLLTGAAPSRPRHMLPYFVDA